MNSALPPPAVADPVSTLEDTNGVSGKRAWPQEGTTSPANLSRGKRVRKLNPAFKDYEQDKKTEQVLRGSGTNIIPDVAKPKKVSNIVPSEKADTNVKGRTSNRKRNSVDYKQLGEGKKSEKPVKTPQKPGRPRLSKPSPRQSKKAAAAAAAAAVNVATQPDQPASGSGGLTPEQVQSKREALLAQLKGLDKLEAQLASQVPTPVKQRVPKRKVQDEDGDLYTPEAAARAKKIKTTKTSTPRTPQQRKPKTPSQPKSVPTTPLPIVSTPTAPPSSDPLRGVPVPVTPTAPPSTGRARRATKQRVPESPLSASVPNTSMKPYIGLIDKVRKHDLAWPFNQPVDPVKLEIPDYFDVIKTPMDLSTVRATLVKNLYQTPEEMEKDVHQVFINAYAYNPAGHDVCLMAKQVQAYFVEHFQNLKAELEAAKSKPEPPPTPVAPAQKRPKAKKTVPSSRTSLGTPKQAPKIKKTPVKSTSASSSSSTSHSTTPTQPAKPKPLNRNKVFISKPKPKPQQILVPMTIDEKRQLSQNINRLQSHDLGMVVQIIHQGMPQLAEAGAQPDVIEIDIDALDTRTLRNLEAYVKTKIKRKSKKPRSRNTSSKQNDSVEEMTNIQRKLDELAQLPNQSQHIPSSQSSDSSESSTASSSESDSSDSDSDSSTESSDTEDELTISSKESATAPPAAEQEQTPAADADDTEKVQPMDVQVPNDKEKDKETTKETPPPKPVNATPPAEEEKPPIESLPPATSPPKAKEVEKQVELPPILPTAAPAEKVVIQNESSWETLGDQSEQQKPTPPTSESDAKLWHAYKEKEEIVKQKERERDEIEEKLRQEQKALELQQRQENEGTCTTTSQDLAPMEEERTESPPHDQNHMSPVTMDDLEFQLDDFASNTKLPGLQLKATGDSA